MDDNRNQPLTFRYSEPPEGADEYYANHLQVFWTGIDVTLFFGKLLHSSEDIDQKVLSVEKRAKVTLPWPLAKLIATSLAETVAKYEEKNGEVKLPSQYQLP